MIVVAGGIWLQIFLSKKESKWPGLVLPIIFFTFSLLACLGLTAFESFTVISGDGPTVVHRAVTDAPTLFFQFVSVFLYCNIPTAVLLAIYAACRDKRKKQRALEKMSVQDLE